MRSFASIINLTVGFILLFASCSKKSSAPDSMPVAAIRGVTQERTISSSVFKFSVTLNKSTTNAVTVHYTTVAGTAVPTNDFIPVTGTLTIAPNQLQASIDVTVTGDSLRTDDQEFYVELDNPINCTLRHDKATGTITNNDGLYYPVANAGYSTPNSSPHVSE